MPVPVWSSSDPQVATVDENGRVTALLADTAVITAAAADGSEQSAEYLLTVHEQAAAMTMPGALKEIGEEAFINDTSLTYIV